LVGISVRDTGWSLAVSPDLAAPAGMATGSIGFASMAARANSELPSAAGGLLDGAAGDPGFAAASSVIASSAASPVRLIPADLPEPSKEAVLSASKPVSPPHPDRDAAILHPARRPLKS
jgi:hypothetical protein